jgi:hypothetical protein
VTIQPPARLVEVVREPQSRHVTEVSGRRCTFVNSRSPMRIAAIWETSSLSSDHAPKPASAS